MTAMCFFFLMIRRPPRSTLDRSSAASDVYKRQIPEPLGGAHLDPKAAYAAVKSFIKEQWAAIQSVPCLLYTSPSPRDRTRSRMPSSA